MNKFPYNMDNELRMEILGIEPDMESGGVINFDNITYEAMMELIKDDFVDVLDAQNDAPTIQEFIKFVEKYPKENFSFIGYAVMPPREDYRVSIEGLYCESWNRDLAIDFITTFRHADKLSFVEDELYCWFD